MFGLIPFAGMAGKNIMGAIKDRFGKKKALEKEVDDLGLEKGDMDIHVDEDGNVSVTGKAVSQEMKEKIILAIGNVEGVEGVNDQAEADGAASEFHTVVSGDTLSGISKKYYGSWKHYPVIFEANKPMLSDPNKIYPGQVLRIPPLDTATA